MLYDRIDISEGINPTKSNKNRVCMICHFCHLSFFNRGFKFLDYVCNGCHDLTMLNVDISDTVLSLLKMLIIIVLFVTLAKLKQLIYYKILFLKIAGIYIKKYLLKFQSFQDSSFYFLNLVFIKWFILCTSISL